MIRTVALKTTASPSPENVPDAVQAQGSMPDESEEVYLDTMGDASRRYRLNNDLDESNCTGTGKCSDSDMAVDDPLAYQSFLYDVDIEYSPGGSRTSSVGNRNRFKMKYLPYMVSREHRAHNTQSGGLSLASSSSSICEQVTNHENDTTLNQLDVTKTACAFLGNSEYVPTSNFNRRRVVLELISAKLSQSTSHNVPPNSSLSNLVPLSEQSSASISRSTSSTNIVMAGGRRSVASPSSNGPFAAKPVAPVSPSTLSSKRFVNYTILIKTVPGLDGHPAVIERRFSDFLSLYQSFKSQESLARIVDKFITFPKKVYMGNFSLVNIAERSIEFTRLLRLCMAKRNLLWSTPFVSFLVDKELRDAHRLSLCGDPDDVQALIETAYHIEAKLYLSHSQGTGVSKSNSSSLNGTTNDRYSPILPNERVNALSSSSDEAISAGSSSSNHNRPISADVGSSPNQSLCDGPDELDSQTIPKLAMVSVNQRILVTFCMLFITYYRGENYRDLRTAYLGFSQLISSHEYVDSLLNTRHYMTLRACLLFLMNLNQGSVLDESQRIWLKRRLEDIDGAHADMDDSFSVSSQATDNDSSANSPRNSKRFNHNNDTTGVASNASRITRSDLMALLRDRNFCTFSDSSREARR